MVDILNALAIFGAKYLVVVILGIALIWFIKQPQDRKKEVFAYGVVVLPIMYVILKLLALIYYDPRPFVVGNFTPLISHSADNGFPSDHTILSAAAASIVFPYSNKIAWVLWVLTVMVAFSRVYVGIHHPIDVIASIIIAAVTAYIIYVFALPSIVRSKMVC